MDISQLEEDLKTARNEAEIALVLIETNRHELLFTIIEDLFETVQRITDEHCVI